MKSATEFWEEKFNEMPRTDKDKLAVAMMAEYKEDSETKDSEHSSNTQSLKDIAFYLEGILVGKGNLQPLGTNHLENLWKVINEYQNRL